MKVDTEKSTFILLLQFYEPISFMNKSKSPSTADWIVHRNANNGWITWKTEEEKNIDIFRNNR